MILTMGKPTGDVLKYMLWESQGGQCLYGKPAGNPQCPYTETALSFTDLHKYRIDHIVPRAKGGPDSFSNFILTTDEANAAKGDRTPWQWFPIQHPTNPRVACALAGFATFGIGWLVFQTLPLARADPIPPG